jgi:hypothetical protein
MFHGLMIARIKIGLVLGLAALTQPSAAEPARAVVELFTSQGCSSCPPADAVLADLATRADMVAISFPVDYWDYLGWKDTLAQTAFTKRQKAYAKGRNDHQIYTPQMIVNGMVPCIGSDRAQIEQSIKTTTAGLPSLPVPMDATEKDGIVTITVSERPGTVTAQQADIWVLPVTRLKTVTVERGENRGRTIAYANVVRGMNRVGEWTGGAATFKISTETAQENGDGYVVLLQTQDSARPGAIIGAAKGPGL